MARTVYIETTIPSAFVSRRRDTHSLARKEDTHEWWAAQRQNYDCYSSQEVLDELLAGEFPGRDEAIEMLGNMPLLEVNEEVISISGIYVQEKLMPGPAGAGDSFHMALAAYHRVDFLLTWNIRHLANPNKLEHLVVVNRRLGLFTPSIVTPDMLWLEQ